ncbi:MAG: DUF6879 family protein [Pseudonocardiaceae bacterium]
MRLLNPDTSSDDLQGCDRLWADGEDIMVQLRPASTADHQAILPNYVLDRALHPEFDHVREDFVVFDEASVLWYRYTDEDVLTGYDYTGERNVVRDCVALAEEVRAAAVPYREFMARIR